MIKINFTDMPSFFNPNKNFVTDIIEKYGFEPLITDKPDFLFYSCYGNNHYTFQDCVKIFWTVEPVAPNFNECDYAVAFDYIQFSDRYIRRPVWLFEDCPVKNNINDEKALNRKFCNFIYSNENDGYGAQLRKAFALKLMEYKHIDCPGKVLNNLSNAITPRTGDWRDGKLEFISNYKFTIAFENTSYNGYTTEKLTQPLSVHSLPIYWGNPLVNYNFNTNAFIFCNGFENNFDKIIEKIIELDTNDDMYLEMLHQNCMADEYDFDEKEKMERFLVNIFNNGNKPFNKDPMEYNMRNKKIYKPHKLRNIFK